MATDTFLSIFEDFNEPADELAPGPEELDLQPANDDDPVHDAAWTEGYLTGRQEAPVARVEQTLAATLVTSLYQLEAQTAEAIDAASLAVAGLLVNTMIAVASDEWPDKLLGRVRIVADRIKPALTVAPEYILRDKAGTERRFGDITDLSNALEDGVVGEDVTIRWQRGEATISRTALLEDLREAVVPLSAGLVNEQNARQQT